MLRANGNQRSKMDNPAWHLIAEISLNEGEIGEDRNAEIVSGPIFQIIQDLGLPAECHNRIERMIIETIRGARNDIHPGKKDLPVDIRLFCLRKMVERIGHSEDPTNGGWGYYGIERGNTSYEGYQRIVELYLYQEGEERSQ